VISDPGSGITAAVNIGIAAAKGEFVMPWLCSDDYLDRDFVRTVSETFAATNADFVYGNWHVVDRGSIIKSRAPDRKWASKLRHYMPLILPNTFVFKASLLDQIGALDETLRFANDYDLLRRLLKAGYRGAYCPSSWYFFQTGGLSQARHYECAREVAQTALKHGSHRLPTMWHFLRRYLTTKVSFLLNRFRGLP
jgi:GT2 family glycosyltransferase